ncbi:MAG: hypothetical protein ACI4IH_06730 [Eubacterium sp.]
MKQLTCEMCGSTDLMKQDGVFVCQTCGCKYSVDEAKKMMVDGTVDVTGSTVKVDSSEKVKNLYVMARRARDDDNAELAAKYYEMITFENPYDWEALFYFNYFKAKQTNLANMDNSVACLENSLDSIFDLIGKSDKSVDEKWKIAEEIIAKINALCTLFISWAKSHYKEFSHLSNSVIDLDHRAQAIAELQKKMADLLEKHFSEKSKNEILSYLKSYIENYMLLDTVPKSSTDIILQYHSKELIEAEKRIKKLEPEYKSLVDEMSKEKREISEASNKMQNNDISNEAQHTGTIQVNYQMGHQGVNGWVVSPNSAGGVSVRYAMKNIGKKTIKYYVLYFVAYNSVGDIVKCSIHKVSEKGVRGTGPIATNGVQNNSLFENAWYNYSITSVKLVRAEIEYMDGTIEVIKGEQINPIGTPDKRNEKPMTKQAKTIWKVALILMGIEIAVGLALMGLPLLVDDSIVSSDSLLVIGIGVVAGGPFITALIAGIAAKISTAKTEEQNKEENNKK